ncbi:MAG: NnrU family protein [Rhodobacteraceae bacterium]|uniref:NnrU family protein n=1 Tax=Cypionkella sp. TaxID=2811411 RepID=UPI001320CBC5|nr:NnrU family protein [Cypionkella sp.]KAF0173955.1 MAG: NnrU family protein [Paracoccaceae bacterium]MDO8327211.1 NnrU family protein [Cypionkella sp.]
MTLLILGLLLYAGSHLFKRLAPDARAAMGDKGKLLVTALSLAGVVLMVIGYRAWDSGFFWGRHPALVGINNLLMVLAFYLFAASGTKARITTKIRHPQLTAVKVWALGHLLVNGDVASFVLFGGLMMWAVLEVILINRNTPAWVPATTVPAGAEIKAVVATVVVMGLVSVIHIWLGYNPFG